MRLYGGGVVMLNIWLENGAAEEFDCALPRDRGHSQASEVLGVTEDNTEM